MEDVGRLLKLLVPGRVGMRWAQAGLASGSSVLTQEQQEAIRAG